MGSTGNTPKENSPTNTMVEHTNGGILLVPNNHRQGGFKIICLNTGHIITQHIFTEIMILQEVTGCILQRDKNNLKTDTEDHGTSVTGVDG